MAFSGKLSHAQFIPHIAGKILVRSLPACFRLICIRRRVFENHALQLCGNTLIIAGRAEKFRHIGQINTAMFSNGYCQCFAGGVHAGDRVLWANRSLGEHIRLAFELFILIEIFQRAEQIVGRIILKQTPIFAVVEQTVFCGKSVISCVQLCLGCLNVLIRVIVQLLLNQLVDDLPQFHHAGDTGFGIIGQLHLRHNRIFSVVHLTVHHGIGEILYIRVSGERLALDFCIRNIWCFHLDFNILALNMLYRFGKLVGQHCALNGRNGQIVSVWGAFGGQLAQHHLRVVHKILVDSKAILGLAKLHPVRLMVDGAVTLLQEDNIRNHFGASIRLERIIRQTDRAQQVGTLCHVLAGGAVLAVHGVAAGDERHHAARTHLVDGFRKEIIVDGESQLVVRFIVDLVLTERYVAHR